jgi:hypothetical protein
LAFVIFHFLPATSVEQETESKLANDQTAQDSGIAFSPPVALPAYGERDLAVTIEAENNSETLIVEQGRNSSATPQSVPDGPSSGRMFQPIWGHSSSPGGAPDPFVNTNPGVSIDALEIAVANDDEVVLAVQDSFTEVCLETVIRCTIFNRSMTVADFIGRTMRSGAAFHPGFRLNHEENQYLIMGNSLYIRDSNGQTVIPGIQFDS